MGLAAFYDERLPDELQAGCKAGMIRGSRWLVTGLTFSASLGT
jgi:hypothetical protein